MLLTRKPNIIYVLILGINALLVAYFAIQSLCCIDWHDFLNILSQLKSEPVVSVKNCFSKLFLSNIKIFFSRAILLFLTFWVSTYILLLFKIKPNDIFFEKLGRGLTVGVLIGTIGIYAHSQVKLNVYTPLLPATVLSLHDGDNLNQQLIFTKLDEKFLKMLKRAEVGEIKLSIQNANAVNDNQKEDLSRAYYVSIFKVGDIIVDLSKSPYLESQHITELLKTKTISYQSKILRGGYFYFYVRAESKPITHRKDSLILNGSAIPIIDQEKRPDNLPIVFRFEELSGKPILAFY